MDTAEEMTRFSFCFLLRPSFALAPPEPDDRMRDADRRVGGSEAYVQVGSMVIREQNMKTMSHMNKSLGDVPAEQEPPSVTPWEWISLPNLLRQLKNYQTEQIQNKGT